jgi:hypothetical protein
MPVVPAPVVSPKTRFRKVRVPMWAVVRRPQSSPMGLSGAWLVVEV